MIRSYSGNSLEKLGIREKLVGYVQGQTLPALPNGKEIFARYGERENPGHDYVYFAMPIDPISVETRESLKQELLTRYFPEVVKNRVSEGQLWVIFDSSGSVLATGQDFVTPSPNMGGVSSSDVDVAIRRHYPTLTSVLHSGRFGGVNIDSSGDLKDTKGNTATLYFLWLSPGAALPPRADVQQISQASAR